jgi:phage gpG-like protein
MIDIKVSGPSLAGLGDEILLGMQPWAEKEVAFGAELIASNARALLSRESEHASQPGQPPAEHTGKLLKSVKATKPKWNGMEVSAAAGPGAPMTAIGYVQEFGGRVGKDKKVYLPPRPYMRPAEAAAEPVIQARLEKVQ